ncbi:MAG: hypothetical protein IPL29_06240 [Propionivibrio sp.]|nr:hypothetical protein [Propionivibrio sp.]MBK8400663.1 hypothetical protein [Propionivibrio sp.]MBK8745468.1 hypothetical protein [Propionivibrio sp.]MBK8893668.1 hypothetical protein [Propionivibrio sp.]
MRVAHLLAARAFIVAALLLLGACAGYSGSNLRPGISTLPEVVAVMGEPAFRWPSPGGGEQLAYPRGPAGTQTFMVFVGADGRLLRIEGVLDMAHFARIEPGKSDKAAVLRLLGPPQPEWAAYFKARDELVWEWRFCDSWNQVARFDVLFDATTGIVRTSYQRPEYNGWKNDTLSCAH